MKKIWIALTLVLLLVLVTATSVTAGGKTPSGGAPGPRPVAHGRAINLANLPANVPTTVYMLDGWFCWDLTATHTGSMVNLAGIMHEPVYGPWPAYGSAIISKSSLTNLHLVAVNPAADGCSSGGVDWFEYFGTPISKKSMTSAGTWYNYCSGVQQGSGSWVGTFYAGSCPE